MSRLILHIGTHKTATTSIQRFFRRNQDTLAERGVWYPDYSLIGEKPHYAHLGMVNALAGRHDTYSVDTARAFFRAVRERAADHDITVISGEPFYRHVMLAPDETVPRQPEAYWPARQAYVRMVRELLGEAEIVVVFRRQAEYAQSLYQENVKVTRFRRGFKSFLNDFWFHFDFLDQVRAWEAAFGAPTVMGFEQLRATGDIPGAFATTLGIDAGGLERPPRQNEGMLTDLVVLKRMLHGSDLDIEEIKGRIDALDDALPQDLRSALAKRSFFDGPGKRREFQQRFETGNAGLGAYVPGMANSAPLFPAGFPEDTVFGDKLTPPFLDFLSRQAVAGPVSAPSG